jgi:hypothetical protein
MAKKKTKRSVRSRGSARKKTAKRNAAVKRAAAPRRRAVRASERPALTGTSAGRVFGEVLKPNARDPRARQLKKDWRSFVEGQFRLNETQGSNLRDVPAEEVEKIQRAFNEATNRGGKVVFAMAVPASEGSDGKGGSLTIEGGSGGSAATVTPRIKITLIRCTFDANCRNWECKLGPEVPPIR